MAPTNDVQQITEACIPSGTNPFENAASEEWSTILIGPSSSDAVGTCRAFVHSETDSRAALCVDYVLGEHPSQQPEFVLIFAQANCLSFDIHSEIMEGMLQIEPEDEETPFTFCLEGEKGDSILSAPLRVVDRQKILPRITSGTRVIFTLQIYGETIQLPFALNGSAVAVSRVKRHWETSNEIDKQGAGLEEIRILTQRVVTLSAVQCVLAGALARLDYNFEQTIVEMQQAADAPECSDDTRRAFLLLIEFFNSRQRGVRPVRLN